MSIEHVSAEVIVTRDRSSGRIHRRVRLPGEIRWRTFEGDNLDAAGDYDVIGAQELVDADPSALCGHCFPPDGNATEPGA